MMTEFWNTAWLLTNRQDLAEWLSGIRLASNITIVAANASVTWTLFDYVRRGGSGLPVSRRLVALLASAVALCGVSQLGRVLLFHEHAAGVGPTALKLSVAGFWAITAARLPHLMGPLSRHAVGESADPAHRDGTRALEELGVLAERLGLKVRVLESLIRNDNPMMNRADVLRGLEILLDDMETDPCKTSSNYCPTAPAPSR